MKKYKYDAVCEYCGGIYDEGVNFYHGEYVCNDCLSDLIFADNLCITDEELQQDPDYNLDEVLIF